MLGSSLKKNILTDVCDILVLYTYHLEPVAFNSSYETQFKTKLAKLKIPKLWKS